MAKSAKDIARAQILNSATQPQQRQQQQATPTRPIDIARAQIAQSQPVTPVPVQTVTPQPVTPTPTPAPQTTTPSFLNNLLETLGIASQQAQRAVTGTFAPVETQRAENNRLAELSTERAGIAQERKRLEELRKPTEWDGRNELIQELKDFRASSNPNLMTASERKAELDRRQEIIDQLRAGDEAAGNAPRDYTAGDRLTSILSGWGQRTAGNLGNAAVTIGRAAGEAQARQQLNSNNQRLMDMMIGEDTRARAQKYEDAIKSDEYLQNYEKAYNAVDELAERGNTNLARAKEGMGTAGRLAVDVGTGALDLGADAAANFILPGSGMVSMAGRVFGEAAREQRQKGGSQEQQLLAGTKAAAIEVLTEKVAGPFEKIYGKSFAGKAINEALDGLDNKAVKAALKILSDATGESVEEILSDIANPVADHILGLDEAGNTWGDVLADLKDSIPDMLYDGLIGGILGAAGGAVNVANGRPTPEQVAAIKQQAAQAAINAIDNAAVVQAEAPAPAAPLNPDDVLAEKVTGPAQEAAETPVEAAQPAWDIPAPPQTAESTTADYNGLLDEATQAILDAAPDVLSTETSMSEENLASLDETAPPNTIVPEKSQVKANGQERERSFTQNVATSETTEEKLAKSLGKYKTLYKQLTNADVLAKAQEIFDGGVDEARNTVERALGKAQEGAKFPPEMVPLSRMVANELSKRGEVEAARQMIADVAAELTAAGQLSQVGKILRNTDPATALASIEKALARVNETIEKRYGKRYTWRAALTDAEKQQINSTDFTKAGAYEEVYEQIAKRLGKDMPSTLWEKLSEIRRVGMLFRPRTQIKNFASNAPMIPLRMAAEKLSGAIQDSLVKRGKMAASEQTRTGSVSQEAKKLADDYTKDHKEEILESGNKADMDTLLNKHRTIFKYNSALAREASKLTGKELHNLMEDTRRLTYKALEWGDAPYVLKAYKDSLAQICEARGVTDPSKITAEMRDFAFANAMEATYKATNVIAEAINKIKREGGAFGKALDVIIPFTTTPANILSLMGKYSPVGFASALFQGIHTAGDVDAAAKATVGTLAMALGWGLRALGAAKIGKDDEDETAIDKALRYIGITGGADKNTNKAAFDKATGISPYSFGGKVSYDWAEPFGSMLSLGAEVYDAMHEKENWADAFLNAIYTAGDAVLDMSLFQNVTKMLKGYGSNTEAIMQSVMEGSISQLIPGLAGDVARIIDEYQRSTYTGGNAASDAIARGKATIPVLSKKLPENVNVFGEPISRGNATDRIFDALVLPWNTNRNKATETSKAIKEVFEATGDYSVFPSTFPTKIEANDETYKPSGKERELGQTTQGQTYTKIVEQMIDGSLWKDMTAEDKAAALTSARDFSKDEGKREFVENRDMEYKNTRWKTEHNFPFEHLGEYLSFKNQFDKAQKNSDFATLDKLLPKLDKVSEDTRDTMYEKNARLEDMRTAAKKGVDAEEWTRAYKQYLAINKKKITPSDKAEEMKTWIRTSDLPKAKQDVLDDLLKYVSTSVVEAKTYDALREALGDPKMAQHFSHLKREEEANNAAEILSFVANDKEYQDAAVREKVLGTLLTEGQYAAYERAKAEKISMESWAKFLTKLREATVARTKGKSTTPSNADIRTACEKCEWMTEADYKQLLRVYRGK